MFRSIRWRIAVPYVILILVAMAVLATSLSGLLRRTLVSNLETQLRSEALLLAYALTPALPAADTAAIDAEAKRIAGELNARVTIIAADGTVVGESHDEPATMTNHLSRPEVQQALARGQGSSTRFSHTVGYDMLYFAVPVRAGDELLGFARVALSLREIEAQIGRVQGRIVLATLVTTLVAILLALFIAERTARPIRQITELAGQVAQGNLRARLLLASRDEVGVLAERFNYMARQLEEKVDALAGERSRLAAVLHHMADGVVIADAGGQVQLINPAAARFLKVAAGDAPGRSVAEVLQDHRLIQLWQACEQAGAQQTAALELAGQRRFLQAIATPLRSIDAGACLIILQDLTEVRRSERVRRDFVSNLSHELRTPLASLKALVDTLRDGALDDPPAAHHFLNRMEIEVDALTQMVQ
jgi:two-component system phosphate regulon sensor histidine kinase PhoR